MKKAAAPRPRPPDPGPDQPGPRYVVLGDGQATPDSRASRIWQFVRQLILALVPLGIALFFVAVVVHQLRRGTVEIGRIEVPARLVEAGLTPEAVARRLVDALDRASDASQAESARRPMTMLAGAVPDFSVPVAGISLRSLAELVRDLFGLPKTEVSGEILLVQDQLSIRLRLWGRGEVVREEGFAPHAVDALLAAAAPGLWRALQPQIYAWHIAETLQDQEEVLRRLAALRLDPALDTAARDAAAYLTGQALLRAGRPEEALGVFTALTRARPTYAQGWSGTAQALAALGRPDQALAALAEAVRRHRASPWSHLFAARLLLEQGRAAAALEEVEAGLLLLAPHQPELGVLRISALAAAGRGADAVAAAAAWRAERPDLAAAHLAGGLALLASGRPEAALSACARAARLAPSGSGEPIAEALACQDAARARLGATPQPRRAISPPAARRARRSSRSAPPPTPPGRAARPRSSAAPPPGSPHGPRPRRASPGASARAGVPRPWW